MRRLFARRRDQRAGATDAGMAVVLAAHGIPLDGSPSNPLAALTTGTAKAGIFHAHTAVEHGRPLDALEHLEAVLADPALRHPADAPIAAAAFCGRGRAHEANGHPLPARV